MARLRWFTVLLFVCLVGVLLSLPNDASSQVCPWSMQVQRTQIQMPNRCSAPPMQTRIQPQMRMPLPQCNTPRVSLQQRPPCQTQVRQNLQFQPRLPQIQCNLRVPARPIIMQQVPTRPTIPTFTGRCGSPPQPRLQQSPPRTVQFSRPPIQTQIALQPRLPQITRRTCDTPRLPQMGQPRLPQFPQLVRRPQPQIPTQSRPGLSIPQARINPPVNLVNLRTRFTCVGCHVRCNQGGPNLAHPPAMPGQFANRPTLPPPVFAQRPNLPPPLLAQRPNLPNLLLQQPTLPNLLLLQRPNLPNLVLQRQGVPALPVMLRQPNPTLPNLMLQPPVQLPTLLARMPAVNPPALPLALRRPEVTLPTALTPPSLQTLLVRPVPGRGEAQPMSPGEQETSIPDPFYTLTSPVRPSTADSLSPNLLALERPEPTSNRLVAPRSFTPSLLDTLRGAPTTPVALRETLDRPLLPALPPTVLQRVTEDEPSEPESPVVPELPLDHPTALQLPATATPASATSTRIAVPLPLPPTVLVR